MASEDYLNVSSEDISYEEEDFGETECVPVKKKGFAKLDLVDVILSDDKPVEETKNKQNPSFFDKLSSSVLQRKTGGSVINQPDDLPVIGYQPTFRLEPKKKFDADKVHNIIKNYLTKELKDMTYGEKECQTACKRISYYLRKVIKQLNYDRYRIICQARIVEKQAQGLETRTGFLLDPNFDGWASFSMETQSLAAHAVVYGIYKD